MSQSTIKTNLVKGSPDARKAEALAKSKAKATVTKSPTVKSNTVKAVVKTASSPKEAKTVKTAKKVSGLSNDRLAKLSNRIVKKQEKFLSRCSKFIAIKDKTDNTKFARLQGEVKEMIDHFNS